jgi:hypothetical protein
MNRAELRWCLGYSAMLAALTSLPYLVALAQADENWVFTGSVIAVEDGNSYIAKMRLGADGDWLFRTPYSTLPQRGVLAFLPYLLLGKLAGPRPSHAALVLLFHASRLAAIPLAVAATYRFSTWWVSSERWRRWGTVLATLGGGLGWLLLFLHPQGKAVVPLELYSPESFGFLASFAVPHLTLARAALLFGLAWHLEAVRQGHWGVAPACAWLGLALLQPLALVPVSAALLAHAGSTLGWPAVEGRRPALGSWLKAAGPELVALALATVYLGVAYLSNPLLQAWARQNLLPSPPVWHYLVSFLLLLPLAGLGAKSLPGRAEARWLVVWPPMLLALAYAPVGVQRRLVEGIWVGLAVLAAVALEQLSARANWPKHLGRAVLALSLPASLLLVAAGWRVGSSPAEPAFRPAAEIAAFDWLAAHAPRGSVVLSSFITGNALPAWAPVRVVMGHGPETAGLAQLRPEVQAFFDPAQPDAARRTLMQSQDVAYVLHGPRERALGTWDPAQADFLQRVYADSGYSIYASR